MAKDRYVETIKHLDIQTNGLKQDSTDANLILFDKPLVITDDTVQKNGTRYDIDSLDLSAFRGKLWANHDVDKFENALAKVIGLKKTGNQVTIDGLRFFNNSYAQLAKDMMLDGAADEFSIGTRGPEYDDLGVFYHHSMHEVSLVGIANNYNAHLNGLDQLVEYAVQNGFDLKKYKLESQMTKISVTNSQSFDVKVTYKNDAGEDTEVVVKPGEAVEVSEDQKGTVEAQVADAEAPKVEEVSTKEEKKTEDVENSASFDYEKLAEMVANKLPKKATFNKQETIEEKQTMTKTVDNKAELSAAGRLLEAVKLERNGLMKTEEFAKLNEEAKAEYKNALGDDELGALIAPAELIPEPTKATKNYQEFLSAFQFRQGRLHYSLNNLYSNVRFVVAGCGVPATQSGADINNLIMTQETLRTYTPVCNKNIEFSEVDVANLFENEYQVAFDRALVEYALGQFEVAVETRVAGYTLSTGKVIAADTSASVAYPASTVTGGARAEALGNWVDSVKDNSDGAVMVTTKKSVRRILRDLAENGVADTTGTINLGDKAMLSAILDTEIVLVPNEMLPTVGSGSTVTITREGASNITVNHGAFIVSPDNFLGLYAPMTFDVSSEASYEVEEDDGAGGTVTKSRSPKLYDETVLWGRMHRGGGVRDLRFVAGLQA